MCKCKISIFQLALLYFIEIYCGDYVESNNSISLESEDINEVHSTEYLDTLDNDFEKNNAVYNKNSIIEKSIESIRLQREDKRQASNKETWDNNERKEDSDQYLHANTTTFIKCPLKNDQSEENNDSSEEIECKNTLLNHPFSASILRKGSHYASGALLDNQTVLTVAADFYNVRESIKLYKVRLGSVNCKKGGKLLHIKSIHIHPSYESGNPAFDVAVFKLAEQVKLTEYIKPIFLSNVTQKVISANFMTTYWPRLIVQGKTLPKSAKERIKYHNMRVSTQKLIPWKNCYTLMESTGVELNQNSLCLKPIKTHHSVCMPDPGAPVLAEDGLWGISSGWTSKNCKSSQSPTIFTRTSLSPVRKWLQKLMS
ncbi:unnamed protein product [Diatraea saccharalis]|uniref:Peptidase S1 domain-containing protein n=1 Tax=Diatraea saccharalis TaxID=40085 RepID=A0A9N9RAL4_9NEOP|nr:unnamed protein product [Diatraea saccharalis]